MKIYLLNPPFKPNFVRCGRWQGSVARGGTLYYPIFLSYATGVLERAGYNVRLVDAIARSWDRNKVVEDIKKFCPNIIIADSNFSSLSNDINILNFLKKKSNAITILVGPPTSQFPERILNDGVDLVARLEYEFTLKEVVKTIEKEKDLKNIYGISYKSGKKIVHNPNREFINSKELDEMPFVSKIYKKHLNISDYVLNHTLHPMVQIFTSRGCPNQCIFCSWPKTLLGRKYRVRSAKNIADEFEYIATELPEIKEIFIEDDTFTIDKKRIAQFTEEVIRRDLDVTWSCNARANLDYESMIKMKKAGCRLLDVGYESGSDILLKNMKKGITTRDSKKFTKDAKKAGLMILADFIFGMPGENKETANQTIQFSKEIKPDIIQFAPATPIPGTEYYDWVKNKGYLLYDNVEDSIDEKGYQKCNVSYPSFSDKDITNYVVKGLKDFYLNPSYLPIAMKNIINKNGWQDIKMLSKSLFYFIKYLNGR